METSYEKVKLEHWWRETLLLKNSKVHPNLQSYRYTSLGMMDSICKVYKIEVRQFLTNFFA